MYYKELEVGKYYDVILSSDDNEYKHLKLIEFNYTGVNPVLYFVNNEGRKITFNYCDVLDIAESKEKEEKHSAHLYFKDKMLQVKSKNYCIKERIQKNFYKVYNNCIIDSIKWIEKVPHLRIITENDRVKCINMLFIEDIDDAE